MFCMVDDVVLGSAIPKKRDVGVVAVGENSNTQALECPGKQVGRPEDPGLLRRPSIVGTPIKTVYKHDAGTIAIRSA